MPTLLTDLATSLFATVVDVLPIAIIVLVFQLAVLRQVPPNPGKIALGFGYVLLGLALFLLGLERALFPIGETMAQQLTSPEVIGVTDGGGVDWTDYMWVYAFAAAIGFATTVAEPALIAVSLKAGEVSGGTLDPWRLRLAVAVGVGLSIAVGAFRIVTGTPLVVYMVVGYVLVVIQTYFAPRLIIPLAYDSGGVTTSTVTVPLVIATGLGLASTVPGRSPLLDGFGLIALASLFPMITVMAYAQFTAWQESRRSAAQSNGPRNDKAGEE